MDFKGTDKIEIREGADRWGPYSFDLASSLPSGSTIQAVNVQGYAGKYKPSQAVEDQTQIDLVDPEYTPVINGTTVSMEFQYPGDAFKGKATVVMTVTLDTGGIFPFFLHRVKVI